MIKTIDEITADDLFNALGDSDFANKLYDASQRRIKHHYGWLKQHEKNSRDDSVSREYKKTKAYMKLSRAAIKLI